MFNREICFLKYFFIKFQKMTDRIVKIFYLQLYSIFGWNRYFRLFIGFWPISVYFNVLKMSPSSARRQITFKTRDDLIVGIPIPMIFIPIPRIPKYLGIFHVRNLLGFLPQPIRIPIPVIIYGSVFSNNFSLRKIKTNCMAFFRYNKGTLFLKEISGGHLARKCHWLCSRALSKHISRGLRLDPGPFPTIYYHMKSKPWQ